MIWHMKLPGAYRHELKYPINTADYYALRQRISSFMKHDPHTGRDGVYTVHSIYFDNADDKALREKIYGVQKREKFRIRYYNDDLSFITLEKKTKYNDLCMKLDAKLSEDEYLALLSGETEQALIKQIALFCEALRLAARDYDPSHINRYLVELAGAFHKFYTDCRIKGEESHLLAARLKLAASTRTVLKNGMDLLGVTAPEKM